MCVLESEVKSKPSKCENNHLSLQDQKLLAVDKIMFGSILLKVSFLWVLII